MKKLCLFFFFISVNTFAETFTTGNWTFTYPESWSTSNAQWGEVGGPTPHGFWNDGAAAEIRTSIGNGFYPGSPLGTGTIIQVDQYGCPPMPWEAGGYDHHDGTTDLMPNLLVGTLLGAPKLTGMVHSALNRFYLWSYLDQSCHGPNVNTLYTTDGETEILAQANGYIARQKIVLSGRDGGIGYIYIDLNSYVFVYSIMDDDVNIPESEEQEANQILLSAVSNNPDTDLTDQAISSFMDSDTDGISDEFELAWGGDSTSTDYNTFLTEVQNLPVDSDRDGIPDEYETAAGGDTTSSTFESVLAMLSVNKNVPAMGGIGLLALGLSMLGLGAVRLRKKL
ncbi:MAG: hypothetical protein CL691_03405 [Cellvibrionales bacterium]|nr:hypothetical protein [Cellvibrionales bacterium]|tara:strand:- start:1769 stop:2782 length:1014 start_codon:yes stop_codon:yes gene_type:complete